MDIYLAPEPPDEGEEVDPFGPDSGLAALATFCGSVGLPLPPMPEALVPLLREVARGVFTSRSGLATLSGMDALAAEAAAGEAPPFVALSHEGVGTNSWYLRYCVSIPGVHLYATVPFGGLYMDPDSDVATVSDLFEDAATLIERGLSHGGGRDFVIDYRGPGRAQWCEAGGAWQDDPAALSTVADRLVM